jgi:chemotaxis protein CheD
MRIATSPGDVIVTHALGSCLGISAHDPVAQVGGLLHVMMPMSNINPDKARLNPYMFVDTGVPKFFQELYGAGATKGRLCVKVAGGANVHANSKDTFAIGKRNFIVLKKMFWKNGVMLDAEDVGGQHARTMYVEIGSGRVWLSTRGQTKDL